MNNQIEEVKQKNDIVEYIGARIHLIKAGRNFRALCPFHHEKSASFVISPDRQIWHCFGACHDGGDVIKFAMKWDNITFYEALKQLADRAGIKLLDSNIKDEAWEKKDRILRINSLAARYFEYVLDKTSVGAQAMAYLTNRGIKPAIIKTFRIGYAPKSWDSLKSFFRKHDFSEQELIDAGMLIRNENGRTYDRFRGRIMFPICDIRGDIIGFSGRILQSSDREAKYINTPETEIYHKRESLYGINITKDAIRKNGYAILVEGEFDMITPFMHGFDAVVAIKGSAVTQEQLQILKRLTNKIIMALDADEAGEEAMRRGIQEAEKQDFELQVATFEGGKDPDEILREDPLSFKKAIKMAEPVYDFIIKIASKRFPGEDPFAKKRVGDFVVPYISRIRNPIVQSYYIKKLATILEISEDAITATVKKYRYTAPEKRQIVIKDHKKSAFNREDGMQKYLMSTLFQSDQPYQLIDEIQLVLEPEDFVIPAYGKIYSHFIEYRKKHPDIIDRSEFVRSLPPELQPTYDELLLYNSSEKEEPKEAFKRLLYELKRNSLKRRISVLISTDKDIASDEAVIQDYSAKLNSVEKQLRTL